MNEAQVYTFDEINDGIRVVFSGSLIVENMAIVKEKVEWLCSPRVRGPVAVQVNHVSALDLSFMQLLAVFSGRLDEMGIPYSISWEIEDELLLLLKKTGFEKYV